MNTAENQRLHKTWPERDGTEIHFQPKALWLEHSGRSLAPGSLCEPGRSKYQTHIFHSRQLPFLPTRRLKCPHCSLKFHFSMASGRAPRTAILSLLEDGCYSGTSALSCTVGGCALIQTMDLLQNMNCNSKFDFCLPTIPADGNMTPISFGILLSKSESCLARGIGYTQKLNVSNSFKLKK